MIISHLAKIVNCEQKTILSFYSDLNLKIPLILIIYNPTQAYILS